MTTIPPTFIVGIGGSAGGLSACQAFMDAVSPQTGMAFVIVLHIIPDATSQLAWILSRRTKMPVTVAETAMQIRANHVYVCPPNADLHAEKGDTLRIVSPRTKRNVQVDVLYVIVPGHASARHRRRLLWL